MQVRILFNHARVTALAKYVIRTRFAYILDSEESLFEAIITPIFLPAVCLWLVEEMEMVV